MLRLASVTLKNFRYHKSRKISLPSKGDYMVKFSGDSGSGKSSMVSGIFYGLFGKVWKSKKLAKYGEKVFSVTLVLRSSNGDLWKIHRVNTPKTLKLYLNDKLYSKGDEAEEKITDLIGISYKQYIWGFFLRGNTSILETSPQEKYEAVCALAGVVSSQIDQNFKDIQEHKKSEEARLKIFDVKLGRLQGILSSLKQGLQEYQDLPPEVDLDTYPETRKDLRAIENSLAEVEDQLANFGDSERASLEKEKISLETQLAIVVTEVQESEGYTPEYISSAKLANEVRKARLTYSETQLLVKKQNARRLKEINEFYETNLPKGIAPQDFREWVSDLRGRWSTYQQNFNNVEKLTKQHQKAKIDLSNTFQKIRKLFKGFDDIKSAKLFLSRLEKTKIKYAPKGACPHCQSPLAYLDQTFVDLDVDDETEEDPAMLDKISNFQEEIRRLADIISLEIPEPTPKPKFSLDRAEELLHQVETCQVEARSIEAGKSPLLTKAGTALKKLEDSLNALEEPLDPNDVTDEDVVSYELMAETHLRKTKEQKSLEKRLHAVTTKLENSDSIESLLELSASLREQKQHMETRLREKEEAKRTNQLHTSMAKILENIEKETSNLKKVEKAKKRSEDTIQGLQGLKVKIKEAVLKSIEETIDNINQKSQTYLDRLFDDRLSIRLVLSPTTEGKIQIQVDRPGNPNLDGLISFDDLSDGEIQRARLAFFLGINDHLNPELKLLVIDDSLGKVEEDLNSTFMDLLIEREGTKIVIAFEVLEGKFDREVEFFKEGS